MSTTDDSVYIPFTYGYSNYSRKGYTLKHICFGAASQFVENKVGSTMLGGTGLAISSNLKEVDWCKKYAELYML